MRKLPARKLLGTIIAGALFLPHTGFTLGLGEIEVNSALNQTLNADIELLSATIEDTENLIIKLASRKEFLRAGLDRPYLLSDLRFKSEEINGIPYIKVSSGSPIREPFLNFLVEIDWPNGHLLREYTVLLDPPVFMTQPASIASAPVSDNADFRPTASGSTNVVPVPMPGTTASSRPSTQAPVQQTQSALAQQAPVTQINTQPSWVPAPVGKQPAVINQQAGRYRIKAGDTAWSLADAMRPDQSISVSQMMIALLRANPESFINENINGLKRGYILRVPDYEQIVAIDQADARAIVREQAALWRQYQQSQSGGQPVSAMEADANVATDNDAAVITGEENDAYLEIVSAGSGSSTASGKDPTEMSSAELRAELALARERVETGQVEKEELQQRVDTLEQHVDKMKGMLSIEDAELANVQALNESAEREIVDAEDVMSDISSEEAALEEADTESMAGETAAPDSAEDVMAEMPEDMVAENVEGSEETLFAEEASVEGADETVSEMPTATESASDNIETEQPQAVDQEPEPDFLTQLLNNPMMLAAAGGFLLLIAGLVGLIIKRRKAASEIAPLIADLEDDLGTVADDVADTDVGIESLEDNQGLAGDESLVDDFDSGSAMMLDSAEDTIIDGDATAAGDDDGPRDDVIAEADVYLAYGIYQQAEDLLAQAIADNPDRDDYRVKLAETHYASKNENAFVEVASEIKKRTDNLDSAIWKKVVVMGQDMCPDNPLFQGSMVGGLDVNAIAPGAPSMDFDLGIDEATDAPSLDLSLDDDSLELPDLDADDSMADVEEAAAEETNELEFDISDTGAVEETVVAEDEFSLDIDASELDIDMQDAVEETVDEVEESIDLGDIDLGLDLDDGSSADETSDVADIDFGLVDDSTSGATETEEAEEDISLDLSDEVAAMDDDIPLDMGLVEETEAPAASSDSYDDDDFDLSSLDDVDEIGTKLDLARAYLDMGDHEGTRGILEEVLADGNDEQKQEANDLMAKLN